MTELLIHQQHGDEFGRANCPRGFCAEERFTSVELATGFEPLTDPAIAKEVVASRVEHQSSELLYLNVNLERQLPSRQCESPSTFSPNAFSLKKVGATGHR
jgi:hypothetical protein